MSLFYLQIAIWIVIYLIFGLILETVLYRNDPEKISVTGAVITPIFLVAVLLFTIIVIPLALVTSVIDGLLKK